MALATISPAYADQLHEVAFGSQPATSGGINPTVVLGDWLGCLMPMDGVSINTGGSVYIANRVVVAIRTGSGSEQASAAKYGVWRSTDDGATWSKIVDIDVTSQFNAASTSSHSIETLDLTGEALVDRTFTINPGDKVAWGLVAAVTTAGGVFLKRYSSGGIQTAKWLRLGKADTDDLSTILDSDFESWDGDIAGYCVFETLDETWCEITVGDLDTALLERLPWSPSGAYQIMHLGVRTPDAGTTTMDLETLTGDTDTKLADFDIVMSGSGTDKVTFGPTPADLVFGNTYGRPDDDAIDFWVNVWDSSGVKCELMRRSRRRSETGLSDEDLQVIAHRSTIADTHQSADSLSNYPSQVRIPITSGASVERIVVGRMMLAVGDSQASRFASNEITTYRVTEGLEAQMARKQVVMLIATPGGKMHWDASSKTAFINTWEHPTDVDKGSLISGARGTTIYIAGIGVNDVSDVINDGTEIPEFLDLIWRDLMKVWGDQVNGGNPDSNRFLVLGLPDYRDASTQDRRDTVQRLSYLYQSFARVIGAPCYEPFQLTIDNPAYIGGDDLHYEDVGAAVVLTSLIAALEGDLNAPFSTAANEAIALAVKEALFDASSQSNKLAVSATGGTTVSTVESAPLAAIAAEVDGDLDLDQLKTDAGDAAAAVRNKVRHVRSTGVTTVFEDDGTTTRYERTATGSASGDQIEEVPA